MPATWTPQDWFNQSVHHTGLGNRGGTDYNPRSRCRRPGTGRKSRKTERNSLWSCPSDVVLLALSTSRWYRLTMAGINMATCRHQVQDKKLIDLNSRWNSPIWLVPSWRTNSHFHSREFLIAQQSFGPAVGTREICDAAVSFKQLDDGKNADNYEPQVNDRVAVQQ